MYRVAGNAEGQSWSVLCVGSGQASDEDPSGTSLRFKVPPGKGSLEELSNVGLAVLENQQIYPGIV